MKSGLFGFWLEFRKTERLLKGTREAWYQRNFDAAEVKENAKKSEGPSVDNFNPDVTPNIEGTQEYQHGKAPDEEMGFTPRRFWRIIK
ncbi:hypothetical protein PG993_003645 [Apiospora rasikravindrae]|uniref:Uncharacterized protein n=1 Tax=Apiospora rasikravindrae TaxID=990691 RepID=A0ABR1U031_9PEZI